MRIWAYTLIIRCLILLFINYLPDSTHVKISQKTILLRFKAFFESFSVSFLAGFLGLWYYLRLFNHQRLHELFILWFLQFSSRIKMFISKWLIHIFLSLFIVLTSHYSIIYFHLIISLVIIHISFLLMVHFFLFLIIVCKVPCSHSSIKIKKLLSSSKNLLNSQIFLWRIFEWIFSSVLTCKRILSETKIDLLITLQANLNLVLTSRTW